MPSQVLGHVVRRLRHTVPLMYAGCAHAVRTLHARHGKTSFEKCCRHVLHNFHDVGKARRSKPRYMEDVCHKWKKKETKSASSGTKPTPDGIGHVTTHSRDPAMNLFERYA